MDETLLMMLIKQYANRFGMTFSSRWMATSEGCEKVAKLIREALSDKRGPITDKDIEAS